LSSNPDADRSAARLPFAGAIHSRSDARRSQFLPAISPARS